MQMNPRAPYAHGQHLMAKPPIVVTDNDVLCGRGVNIAAHPGNERFRTLVTTRADESYCESYSATEKRAVSEEIVKHVASLNPPGRFLKREGRGQVSRGLNGPWEELSRKESVKKTCQALRDCNRMDRETYAQGVAPPSDVVESAKERAKAGMSGKELAEKAAGELREENQKRQREAMMAAGIPPDQVEEQLKRQKMDPTYIIPGFGMTSNGQFQPLPYGHPPPMTMIGPDGMPMSSADPASMGIVPPLMMPYDPPAPSPADPAAQAAARIAAGYIHPDQKKGKSNITLDHHNHGQTTDDAALAAEEAAAAVAGLDAAMNGNPRKKRVKTETNSIKAEAAGGAVEVQI